MLIQGWRLKALDALVAQRRIGTGEDTPSSESSLLIPQGLKEVTAHIHDKYKLLMSFFLLKDGQLEDLANNVTVECSGLESGDESAARKGKQEGNIVKTFASMVRNS